RAGGAGLSRGRLRPPRVQPRGRALAGGLAHPFDCDRSGAMSGSGRRTGDGGRAASRSSVAIGLRAKSGRAIAVILRGPLEKPIVLAREELVFTIARLRQPFHAVLDLPWEEASAAVRPVAAQIAADAGSALK